MTQTNFKRVIKSNPMEKEELIKKMERLSLKCISLQKDLESSFDEKEELIKERDLYKQKMCRLNHELNMQLKSKNEMLDIDAIIMENKCLKEKLDQTLLENELSNQTVRKYNKIIESKQNKGSLKLGLGNLSETVISQKQAHQLLECRLPNRQETLQDLKSLSSALLEALQDKSIALEHQRRINKLLANRISDLEKRLKSNENSTISPCEILLYNYDSSKVDKDLLKDLATEYEIRNEKMANGRCSQPVVDRYSDIKTSLPPELQSMFMEVLNETFGSKDT